LLPKTGPIR